MLKAFQQGAALKRLQEERKAATRGRGRGNWRGRGRSFKPRGGRSAKPVPPAEESSSSAPSESDSDSGAADSYGASKGVSHSRCVSICTIDTAGNGGDTL